jgi:hypothetical protein
MSCRQAIRDLLPSWREAIIHFICGGPERISADIVGKSVDFQDGVIRGDVFECDTSLALDDGELRGESAGYGLCVPTIACYLPGVRAEPRLIKFLELLFTLSEISY